MIDKIPNSKHIPIEIQVPGWTEKQYFKSSTTIASRQYSVSFFAKCTFFVTRQLYVQHWHIEQWKIRVMVNNTRYDFGSMAIWNTYFCQYSSVNFGHLLRLQCNRPLRFGCFVASFQTLWGYSWEFLILNSCTYVDNGSLYWISAVAGDHLYCRY